MITRYHPENCGANVSPLILLNDTAGWLHGEAIVIGVYFQLLAFLRHLHLVSRVVSQVALRMNQLVCSFAHHRVTIPPSGWVTAAHRQGVRMLGTL